MMAGPPDSVQILYEVFTLDGGVLAAEIGTRAWCPIAPSDWRNEEPAIVYSFLAPVLDVSRRSERGEVSVRCYGGSTQFTDANRLMRLLGKQVHDQSFDVAAGGIAWIWQASSNPSLRDPDTGWPYAQSTWIYQAVARPD